MSKHVNEDNYLQANVKGKQLKMYIAASVPEKTNFVTQTRKEISDIRWFHIAELLNSDKRFWNVKPFAHKLQA
jgi:hypothetical protein